MERLSTDGAENILLVRADFYCAKIVKKTREMDGNRRELTESMEFGK